MLSLGLGFRLLERGCLLAGYERVGQIFAPGLAQSAGQLLVLERGSNFAVAVCADKSLTVLLPP